MESHHSNQHSFSRPHCRITISDSQLPPIPPPPYSSSTSPPQNEFLHRNDPFLRRRTERDPRRTSSPNANQPQSYMTTNTPYHKPSPLTGLHLSTARDVPVQSGGDKPEMLYGNRRDDRYQAPNTGGMSSRVESFMTVSYFSLSR